MIDLPEYQRLRKIADDLRRDADRAEGRLESLKTRLKAEFGCGVKGAGKLLAELEEEERTLQQELEGELVRLKNDFPKLWEDAR